MTQYVVGVDFGGTHLRAALVNSEGKVVERIKRETQARLGPTGVINRIAEAVRDMMTSLDEADHLDGVGVIAPGPSDPFRGIVLKAPNLVGWEEIPLADELHARLGLPVWIGNDANLAALAEHRYGAGRAVHHLIYITISTGIGGGIIVDDRLLLGANGLAAEVGHMQIMPEGPICGCGNRGCVEALASGPNIARAARERLAHGMESSLQTLPHAITAVDVVAAARAGDALACEVLEEAGEFIGQALANLIHLFNPQRFIIGGGVSNAGDLLLGPMRHETQRRTMPSYHDTYDIVRAELGDDVGLLGAAALAFAMAAGG